MKSLLVLIIVLRLFKSMKFKRHAPESFFYLKCIIYFFVSSISSSFIMVPVPLGAILMSILSVLDPKNKKLKYQMILLGLFIVVLSVINFENLTHPIQNSYLDWKLSKTEKIEIYAYTSDHSSFLFSVDHSNGLEEWIEQLTSSTASSSFNHKNLGSELGYLLKVHSNDEILDIKIKPYLNHYANIFVGTYQLPFFNEDIVLFLDDIYSRSPSQLTINHSKDTSINITNPTLLSILWRNILWNDAPTLLESTQDVFHIPAYLFFEKYLGCRISFSDSFEYAYIQNRGILELPSSLQSILEEQFILSQLDLVTELSHFEPAHIYTPLSTTQNFSILTDPSGLYHGLYKHSLSDNTETLLHTVQSPEAEFFVLKYPYILILDESSSNETYLMLINQNIPGKQRYISKNHFIEPRSLSICPQNQNFAYISVENDHSILYLVSDYYRSPIPIANGLIEDSLFLTNDLLVFTQQLNDEQLLCIYDLTHKQVIKYVLIPGNVILTKSADEKVYFAVQQIDGLHLKEAQFFINSNLQLQKVSPLK